MATGTITMNTPIVENGLYRHYKGNLYRVFAVARHSETDEFLVVYQPQYGDRHFWVRPASMFTETVTVEGVTQPRFAFESSLPADQQDFVEGNSVPTKSSLWQRWFKRQ